MGKGWEPAYAGCGSGAFPHSSSCSGLRELGLLKRLKSMASRLASPDFQGQKKRPSYFILRKLLSFPPTSKCRVVAGQRVTRVAVQVRPCCRPFLSWQGQHKPLAFALISAPWLSLFSLVVSSAREGWAVCQHLRIVPAAGGRLSSSTGASSLGLPLAVHWEMGLSLSFCPVLYSAVCWDLGSLHYSKGQGRSLASK